ncbi:MAG: hypothetical protein FJW69_00380 [Actinobacteria bacterium]|nr:hypothetical protein [Actinomycetota bacterium]MBM3712035.1 hypothetical protein [Actinomycetota bacterium]
MKIIDTHFHLGDWGNEIDYSEDTVISALEKNNLEAMILQPFPVAKDHMDVHLRISNLAKKNPGKFFGIISINPYCEDKEYNKSVEKIINFGSFVGIKLHPLGHSISPISIDAKKVYEIAKKHNLPVMIHTGLTSMGDPALALVPAKNYPEIKFILAHSGWSHATQAMVTANQYDNIYLETSWTSIFDKSAIVRGVGSKKVMFGSDGLENIEVEITQYKNLNLDNKDLENIFNNTARDVFSI